MTPPYIRISSPKRLTLVLDLDETLLHYMEPSSTLECSEGGGGIASEGKLNIRPGADEFLGILG